MSLTQGQLLTDRHDLAHAHLKQAYKAIKKRDGLNSEPVGTYATTPSMRSCHGSLTESHRR